MRGTATSTELDTFLDAIADLIGLALRSIAPEGLHVAQFRLLLLLHEHGTTSSAQMARLLDVVPSTVTRMSERLATVGLIERNGSPAHRGMVALSLTPAGSTMVERVLDRRREELAGVLALLPESDRRAATDAMSALHDALRSPRPTTNP